MRAHILGIGGTFMGNLALLLQQLGWQVSGSDGQVYPPVSNLLHQAGIRVEPYAATLSKQAVDYFVVGNSVSRGNELLEAILDRDRAYISGPELLAQQVLVDRDVIAVAGTHGKTTITSMLIHLFYTMGYAPGYLVGGCVETPHGRRGSLLGRDRVFIIEADEYDTAFSDKRAKFVHYRPRWALLNNLEFDHADIYPDLAAIEAQFHHLLRLLPRQGVVIYPQDDAALNRVVQRGLWSQPVVLGRDWQISRDSQHWLVQHAGASQQLDLQVAGAHNARNALAAIATAHCTGLPWKDAVSALGSFSNAARRMELLGRHNQVSYYTDFAHHPTAIAVTLQALREVAGAGRLLTILHPASNTMKSEVHKDVLVSALQQADKLWLYQPHAKAYDLTSALSSHPGWRGIFAEATALAHSLHAEAQPGDHVISLSNGDIFKVHEALLQQ